METTKLSTKGQVIIPKSIRAHYKWDTGQELIIIESEDGIFLKSKRPFAENSLEAIAGCLNYKGKAKSIDDMEAAIAKGVALKHDRR